MNVRSEFIMDSPANDHHYRLESKHLILAIVLLALMTDNVLLSVVGKYLSGVFINLTFYGY